MTQPADGIITVKLTLDTLEAHFLPKTNVVHERYIFRRTIQKDSKSFDSYLSCLRGLASSCNYNALEEEMIRDKCS